jgi:RNA polymerase sigma-70 factor, ECF subfamily
MQTTTDDNLLDYMDGLRKYAMFLTHNDASTPDLLQESYLRALGAKGRLPKDSNLKAWLFTILRNTWLNQLRRRRTAREVVDLDIAGKRHLEPASDDSTDPHILYMRHIVIAQVREAISRLPAEFRQVIFLREYEGLSYREISTILDCPAGTVMSRLARARSRLRILLALSNALT